MFERSAEQAGYHELGKNRLVMPGIAARSLEQGDDQEGNGADENGSGGKPPPPPPPPSPPTRHPFIEGLLKTLPEPETEWKSADRAKWLSTAANIFDLIYKGDGGGISISAARAERSPRPHDD